MSSASSEHPKLGNFRAIIRTEASEQGKSIGSFLHGVLDDSTILENEIKVLTRTTFSTGIFKIKGIKAKFTTTDLEDIFDECDEAIQKTVTVDEVADFCSRTISKARALAIKLRTAILKNRRGEAEYRDEYTTYLGSATKVAGKRELAGYVEDMLGIMMSDADVDGMYELLDMDGDGKLSSDDFVAFILGQTVDVQKALKLGNGEVIVDIKVSTNPTMEGDLTRNDYIALTSESGNRQRPSSEGTFGKGESMWIRKRQQGTCGGRLKPIIDLQLSAAAMSSAMVLSGYTSVTDSVGGQWLWIKRATTEEEEKDAVLDIHVTLGKSKVPSDRIWSSPGVGWIRVDGNFARSSLVDFSRVDAFVWFLPARTRSIDAHMMSPIRSAVALSDELRRETVLNCVRRAIRNYVPLDMMKRLAKSGGDSSAAATPATAVAVVTATGAVPFQDYNSLYHVVSE